MKTLLSLIFVVCLSPAIIASSSTLFGNLPVGSYTVGFKLSDEYDYSRSSCHQGEGARQIRIYAWYPAQSTKGAPLIFRDYVSQALTDVEPRRALDNNMNDGSDNAIPLCRSLSEKQKAHLFTTSTLAFNNVPPLPEKFPLIIMGQGLYYESPLAHALLCEWLASYGYVVLTCPLQGSFSRLVNHDLIDLETQVRDLEYLIAYGYKLPNVDRDQIGLMGFDLGGLSALILAMRHNTIDLLISLDAGIIFQHNTRLLKSSPYYQPERLRLPVLHFTRTTAENEQRQIVEEYSLLDSATAADFTVVRVADMRHVDFTSYAFIPGKNNLPFYWTVDQGNFQEKYAAVCQLILCFLNSHLKNDAASRAFLARPPQEAFPGLPITMEIKKGCPAPPSFDEFVNAILQKGATSAVRMIHDLKLKTPPYAETRLNQLGYQLLYFRNQPEATIAIFKLNTELYPHSANVYDSLGEAYLTHGDKKLAIENYKKSLDLNPENQNAVDVLKQLQRTD